MARFPKGIRKIVDQYADRIEERLEARVDWEKVYGCGSFGCAFEIRGEPERVLKLTADPTEGPVSSAIMKSGLDKRLDGLARIYAVFRIPEKLQEGPRAIGYVIVRENIQPFSWHDYAGWPFRVPPWSNILREFNVSMHKSLEVKREWSQEKHREKASEFLSELWNYQETYYVAEAVEELGRLDIVLADVHLGNLGYRIHPEGEQEVTRVIWFDGQGRPPLLIFDPGHGSAPEGAEIEALYQLAGRANGWLPGEEEAIEPL